MRRTPLWQIGSHTSLAFIALLVLVSCAARPLETTGESFTAVRPEMRALAPFIGAWNSDTPATAKWRTQHSEIQPSRVSRWILNGAAMEHSGWRLDPNASTPTHWAETQTWDPAERSFVSFYVDDRGGWAEVRTVFAPDGRSFEQFDNSIEPDGTRVVGHGSGRLVNPETIEWTWYEGDEATPIVVRNRRVHQ